MGSLKKKKLFFKNVKYPKDKMNMKAKKHLSVFQTYSSTGDIQNAPVLLKEHLFVMEDAHTERLNSMAVMTVSYWTSASVSPLCPLATL